MREIFRVRMDEQRRRKPWWLRTVYCQDCWDITDRPWQVDSLLLCGECGSKRQPPIVMSGP